MAKDIAGTMSYIWRLTVALSIAVGSVVMMAKLGILNQHQGNWLLGISITLITLTAIGVRRARGNK